MTTAEQVCRPRYFDGEAHLGGRVIVVGKAVEDLPGDAVVLTAAGYGDDSLLVLVPRGKDVRDAAGETTVAGTIGRFSHAEHANEFGLSERSV
ncbi:hypothetical protein [Saccharothrix coeruleofusca]|uniref:hypothetical protein n=1 Tax=Saccharothrix coeruleofusca TaxID=33919 RepID=UPI0016701666|nr:hypothetical protein [Saccharothrix coeruleofusca]